MSLAQEMIDTYPGNLGPMPLGLFVTCIDDCFDCAQACTACADACLAEEELGRLRRCIRLDLDCADICGATGRVISRHSETDLRVVRAQLQACALACELCAVECESHRHGHCEHCAVACRRCQRACTELLEALA
jgi:hypothetical protein